MSEACVLVDRFADGELDAAEADAFRAHLAGCAACQRDLGDILQLRARADGLEALPIPIATRRRAGLRRTLVWAAAAAAVLALGATALFRLRVDETPALFASLTGEPTRGLDVRLCRPDADRYRPYSTTRSAHPTESARTTVSLQALARVEARGDRHALGLAYLLAGDDERAATTLARAEESPEVLSDRAAVEIARGRPIAALPLLERALAGNPRLAQAQWNRALALHALELPNAAAAGFAAVAALGEPGWSDEARRRAQALGDDFEARHRDWLGAWSATQALIASGTQPTTAEVRRFPDMLRLGFYDAVRAAPSAERVRALLPLARALDGDNAAAPLARYVARVAGADFRRRAPLARVYAGVALGKARLAGAELTRYINDLRSTHADDILLGVLYRFDGTPAQIAPLAAATHDPWFELLAIEVDGAARKQQGDFTGAQARLLAGLDRCRNTRLEYRCAKLEFEFADTYRILHWPTPAQEVALRGWQRSRRLDDWKLELRFVALEADIARLQGAFALSRAYLEEEALRDRQTCDMQRHVREERAAMAMSERAEKVARRELDGIGRCPDGQRYTLLGALTLANLARLPGAPAPDPALAESVAAWRAQASRGERAFADMIEGRLAILGDRRAGIAKLEQAITEADAPAPNDADAQKARRHAYTALIADALEHGEVEAGIARVAAFARAAPAARCLLGVAVDEGRVMVLGHDARGERFGTLGDLPANATSGTAIDPESIVPPKLAARFDGCPLVDVLALPPLEGVPAMLPSRIAWRYGAGRAAPPLPARVERLLVSDVEPPPALHLAPLGLTLSSPSAKERAFVHLSGADATVGRVLSALPAADEIEFVTHGLVDLAISDASIVVLTPDGDGQFALTAATIREQHLPRAPLVILGACESGHVAPYLHQSWSLPAAFLTAGARSVVASPAAIEDADAGAFFAQLLERVHGGAPVPVALRDTRQAWLARPGHEWVKEVIAFE